MTNLPVPAAPSRRPLLLSLAFAFLFCGVALAPATAQVRKELGRMWTFESAPLGWFQQAYDWQPSEAWLDHARLSSLRLGRVVPADPKANPPRATETMQWFCSASFVSPHGLIMTNHHCARDPIAGVQGENDWLKDGFYAGAYEAEIKLPGLVVSQLVGQRDVTEEVAAKGVQAVQEAAAAAEPDKKHQVIALYQGGNYQLYSFVYFDD